MTVLEVNPGLSERSARLRYIAAALALACLLTVFITHRARSQASQDGPPAPLSGQRIPVQWAGLAWQIPADLSQSLDHPDATVTRIVVGIHGIDRVANAAFGALMEAQRNAHDREGTPLIVAPQFPTEAERERYHLGGEIPCWRGNRWIQGDESTACDGRSTVISSFTVMDLLLERLASDGLYPNLRSVVVAGHSGGGQFVQRYAAGTGIEEQLARRGITVRWVVANPSSYLYLSPERPAPESPDSFAPPPPPVRSRVAYYNNYKYGLERLNAYMRQRGAGRIRADYPRHNITYLLGERDNDPRHPQLDRGRAALIEGPNRLARGTAYFRYLRHLYGGGIARTQRLAIVPAAGHSARRMFTSEAGVEALFGEPSDSAIAAQ